MPLMLVYFQTWVKSAYFLWLAHRKSTEGTGGVWCWTTLGREIAALTLRGAGYPSGSLLFCSMLWTVLSEDFSYKISFFSLLFGCQGESTAYKKSKVMDNALVFKGDFWGWFFCLSFKIVLPACSKRQSRNPWERKLNLHFEKSCLLSASAGFNPLHD